MVIFNVFDSPTETFVFICAALMLSKYRDQYKWLYFSNSHLSFSYFYPQRVDPRVLKVSMRPKIPKQNENTGGYPLQPPLYYFWWKLKIPSLIRRSCLFSLKPSFIFFYKPCMLPKMFKAINIKT